MRTLGVCAGLSVLLLAGCESSSPSGPTASGSVSASASVTALRTPVEVRPVTSVAAGACPPGLTPGADAGLLAFEDQCLAVGPPAMTIRTVRSAVAEKGAGQVQTGEWQVAIALTDEQRAEWERVSGAATGRRLAIVVDGTVRWAPEIQNAIADGSFTIHVGAEADARALHAQLVG